MTNITLRIVGNDGNVIKIEAEADKNEIEQLEAITGDDGTSPVNVEVIESE